MKIVLNPNTVFKWMLRIIILLLSIHCLFLILKFQFSNLYLSDWSGWFDLNTEANVPSVYSGLALCFCALLLFYIFHTRDSKRSKFRSQWLVLAFVFSFLAIDEMFVIHERTMGFVRETMNLSGLFYYAWIIPYALATLGLGIYFIPMILKLPPRVRNYLILSFVVFTSGAVGMEMIGGLHHEQYGKESYLYSVYYTLEEALEMVGIALFAYTLLWYLAKESTFKSMKVLNFYFYPIVEFSNDRPQGIVE